MPSSHGSSLLALNPKAPYRHPFHLNPNPNSDIYPAVVYLETAVLPEDVVQCQLHIENLGATSPVVVTDALPISLTWTCNLTATQDTPIFEAGLFQWLGDVAPDELITAPRGIYFMSRYSAAVNLNSR